MVSTARIDLEIPLHNDLPRCEVTEQHPAKHFHVLSRLTPKRHDQLIFENSWATNASRAAGTLARLRLSLNKVQRIQLADTVDRTCLVAERHTVAFVCHMHNLGTESGANELRADFVGDRREEGSNGGTVLGIEIGVDLVEDDHRATFRRLKGKDEAEGAKTWN